MRRQPACLSASPTLHRSSSDGQAPFTWLYYPASIWLASKWKLQTVLRPACSDTNFDTLHVPSCAWLRGGGLGDLAGGPAVRIPALAVRLVPGPFGRPCRALGHPRALAAFPWASMWTLCFREAKSQASLFQSFSASLLDLARNPVPAATGTSAAVPVNEDAYGTVDSAKLPLGTAAYTIKRS